MDDEDGGLSPLPPLRRDEDNYRIYTSLWQNMDRENTLIHYRITWSMVLSAAVLTAESFLAGRVFPDQASSRGDLDKLTFFGIMAMLSLAAILFSINTRSGVLAAQRQLDELRKHYYRFGNENENYFENKMCLPRPFGSRKNHNSGNFTARVFAWMMIVIWGVFIILEAFGVFYYGVGVIQASVHR